MDSGSPIETSFDVRTDARGRDPDSHSATLRRYHQLLWGKPLPNGALFELDANLHHKSDLGEFWLASDAIVHTYTGWVKPVRLVEAIRQIPVDEMTAFYDLACTVGAYTAFPAQVAADQSGPERGRLRTRRAGQSRPSRRPAGRGSTGFQARARPTCPCWLAISSQLLPAAWHR